MVYMPQKIKILLVHPQLYLFKEHIDYPYFMNTNMYLSFTPYFDDLDIEVFDAFTETDSGISQSNDGNFFSIGSDFSLEWLGSQYDYIFINISPFNIYYDQNKEICNKIVSHFPTAKKVYLNPYTWWYCYMDITLQDLEKKGYLCDEIINGKVVPEIWEYLWLKQVYQDYSPNFYSIFHQRVCWKNYISFLQKVSKTSILDFYGSDKNSLPLYTSIWCIFNCSFCTSSNPSVKWYQRYDWEEIREEIQYLKSHYNIEHFYILDALFNQKISLSKDILTFLWQNNFQIDIPNGVRFDMLDEDFVSLYSQVSKNLSISIETGSDKMNEKYVWKNADFEKIHQVALWANKYDTKILAHYIVWFPGQSRDEINQTFEFALKLFHDYSIIPLMQCAVVVPGTRLSRQKSYDVPDRLFEKFQNTPLYDTECFTSDQLQQMLGNFHKKVSTADTKKIIINLTYICENNCVFCATWDRYKFSQDIWYIIKELIRYRKKGVHLLDLDGWEPTLYKHLFKVIYYAKKLGYSYINLTSSGRKYKNREYLESVLQTQVDALLVSLHGDTPEIHDSVTQKQWSFADTISGIENIILLRKQYNFNFGINLTLCTLNQDFLESYLFFLEQRNIDVLNIQFMTPFWNVSDEASYAEDTKMCCDILKKILPKLSYKVQLINLPFCFMEWYEEYVIGDIHKMERDMVFVWETPKNLYDYLAVRRKRKEQCTDCIYKIVCDWFYEF